MVKVSFYGAAQEVTGSCFLFDSGKTKILVDCGMFQCPRFCDLRSQEKFQFDPKKVAAVFVTHAHVDHTGRIPKLIKEGFSGKIFSTHPTRELARLMLEDSLGVLEKERKREGGVLIYGEEDIARAMEFWHGLGYHEKVSVGDFSVRLLDSGHILGSAMIEFTFQNKKIVVTGDLGNPPTPLLRDPEEVTDANFLLIEATYGNREHDDRNFRKLKLERVIEGTIKNGGVLMMPAFSLERTQELLFEIYDLMESKRIPSVPIFLDSPLAIKASAIYKKYESFFNKEALLKIKSMGDFFSFPAIKATFTTEESKAINDVKPPKIIIAGSGMSNGGRIIHHERRYLPNPHSTLMLVGYQAAGSMGRMIQDGAREVTILGESVPVRAKIETLHGYSAHPDREQLLAFIEKTRDSLEKLFTTHSEADSGLFMVQRVRDYMGKVAYAPRYGETYEL